MPLPQQQLQITEDHGDILIRGLWTHGTYCIIDVRITDVDAKSNRSKDPFKVLATHKSEKKEVSPGLPQTMLSFFSVRGMNGWTPPRQRSKNFAEETVCPSRQEMGKTLLMDHHCSNEHCRMQSYPPLPPRVPNPDG
jgi:hypothetical protein